MASSLKSKNFRMENLLRDSQNDENIQPKQPDNSIPSKAILSMEQIAQKMAAPFAGNPQPIFLPPQFSFNYSPFQLIAQQCKSPIGHISPATQFSPPSIVGTFTHHPQQIARQRQQASTAIFLQQMSMGSPQSNLSTPGSINTMNSSSGGNNHSLVANDVWNPNFVGMVAAHQIGGQQQQQNCLAKFPLNAIENYNPSAATENKGGLALAANLPTPKTNIGRERKQPVNRKNGKLEENTAMTCSICQKTLTRQYILKEHFRIHTGEKPFECAVCGKRSLNKSNFCAHEKTHRADMPFSCPICGKRFKLNAYLAKHRRNQGRCHVQK